MAKKTVIQNKDSKSESNSDTSNFTNTGNEPDRKLVGFLVSFSATHNGEYWILREGRNPIGSSAQSTIRLQDEQVSANHALMLIRRSKNDDRLMFTLSDQQSSNGIFVNDRDIEYTTHECKDRDIIKIGRYVFILITIDKKEMKLELDESLHQYVKTTVKSKKSTTRTSPYDFPASKGTIIENS